MCVIDPVRDSSPGKCLASELISATPYQFLTLATIPGAFSRLNGKAEDEAVLTLVLNQDQRIFALESAINCLVSEPELVIKPFGRAIAPPSYTYGCTLLEDNRLVLVIDAATLLNRINWH